MTWSTISSPIHVLSSPASRMRHPTGSAATSTAISGAAGAWVRATTACWSSTPRASVLARSCCPSAAPIFVLAVRDATVCSWRQAIRSIRSMSTHKARSEAKVARNRFGDGRKIMDIDRRTMLAAVGAAAATTLTGPAFAAWEESTRYPDPRVQTLDPSFARYRIAQASVERLYTGARWSEGPAWFGDARCLLWSDIPNNRILRWDEASGNVSVYRQPSNNSNGLARDRQGRLVACEHNTRRITRTEFNGKITVLADKFDGKPFNSPNDVVVKSDDSIWFSDPSAANFDPYEGRNEKPELPTNVYRLDPKTGRVTIAVGDIRPNGLAFSPDEKILYLADNNPMPRLLKAYDVVDDKLTNPRAIASAEGGGIFDGFKVDTFGNIWCGAGAGEEHDGVAVFNPQGKKIAKILLPERCANLCFGGLHKNRLFMAASHSLYSLYVNTQGAV